jgi:hypothetical protein
MENKAFIGVDRRSSAALNESFRILLKPVTSLCERPAAKQEETAERDIEHVKHGHYPFR